MSQKYRWTLSLLLACVFAPRLASAQSMEHAGARASGMSAFVAVADDGSALIWNPAGLATGAFFNLAVDLGRTDAATSEQPQFPGRAAGGRPTLISMGIPPFGLSYYRTGTTVLLPTGPAGQLSTGRQDYQVSVRSLVTSQFGVTLAQSITEHIVVAATGKVISGSVIDGTTTIGEWSDGFDYAKSLDASGSTTGDLDIGAMFALGHVHAGVVARNVTEPSFDNTVAGAPAMTIERQIRYGVAWGDRWPGLPTTIVAFDADATRVQYASGERRDIAAGIERWLMGHRVGVRGGFRASTVGDARPIGSVGGSYAIRSVAYVDGFYTKGRDEDRGWGVGLRVTF